MKQLFSNKYVNFISISSKLPDRTECSGKEGERVMISMTEFAAYNAYDQHMCICDQGVCLEGRQEGYYEVYLYSVESFFVEVHYHSPTERFAPLVVFNKGPLLDRYLADISLPPTL
jgi:hypothetical protein